MKGNILAGKVPPGRDALQLWPSRAAGRKGARKPFLHGSEREAVGDGQTHGNMGTQSHRD